MPKSFATCLGDIQDAALRSMVGTRCYDNPGLAIAATKSKVKTANAINYTIDGVFYSKAGTDNLFVHTDVTVQPVGTTKLYALCLDADGNASVIPGTTKLPVIPATKCCIGALKIVTDATHTFTPATTLNDAAGITATYHNLAVVPTSGAEA